MATITEYIRASKLNEKLTLAEIRDLVPRSELDIDAVMKVVMEMDATIFAERSKGEIIAILVSALMVHLLPD